MSCVVCNQPAVSYFTPDIDIRGIGFCLKHKEVVRLAYFALCLGNTDLYNELINSEVKKNKKEGKCIKKKK